MSTAPHSSRFEVQVELKGRPRVDSVIADEAEALRRAEYLLTYGNYTLVRVVEIDAGNARLRVVLERSGASAGPVAATGMLDEAPLCVDATEVYSYPARRALIRAFRPWCDEQNLTVFETLHRPELLRRLGRDEAVFGQALTRLAALQAKASQTAPVERLDALHFLYRELVERAERAATLEPWAQLLTTDGMAVLVRQANDLLPKDEIDSGVTYALARKLESASDWVDKLESLCDLFERARNEPEAIRALDEAIAETLDGPVPIRAVLGHTPDPAAAVSALSQAARGNLEERYCRSLGLLRLNRIIAEHGLPTTRTVLLQRVARTLDGASPLTRQGRPGDASALRAIMGFLRETGGFCGGPGMSKALTHRAQNSFGGETGDLTPEDAVGSIIEQLPDPGSRIGYLLDLLAADFGQEKAVFLTRQLATAFTALTSLRDFFADAPEAWASPDVRESFRRRLYSGGIQTELADLFMRRLEQLARQTSAELASPPRPAAVDMEEVQTVCYQIQALSKIPGRKGPYLALYYKGKEIICGPETTDFVVGRAPDCNLSVGARTASRHHAIVRNRQGDFLLIDRSRNGTYVRIGVNKPVVLRNSGLALTGSGTIHLGGDPNSDDADHLIVFQYMKN